MLIKKAYDCYENENDSGKIDHISRTNRPTHRHKDRYTKYGVPQ